MRSDVQPFGALESQRCLFFGRADTRVFIAGLPEGLALGQPAEEWEDARAALEPAEEVALVECDDQASQHWTAVMDGEGLSAKSAFSELRSRDCIAVAPTWLIETFEPEHFLVVLPGWLEDWGQGRVGPKHVT